MLSGLTCSLVLATFFVPLLLGEMAKSVFGALGSAGSIAVLFAYYVVSYAVVIFFNAAVIGCAVKRLRGGDPSVGDGFTSALQRFPQILGWAVVSATVGLVLHLLEEQKVVGKLLAMILGSAWGLMTFFAVPFLVVEGKGPIDALRDSSRLLKDTWGPQVRGNFSFGLLFFVLTLPCIGLIVLGVTADHPGMLVACAVTGGLGLVILAVVHSALYAIFQSAMFLHARGEAIEGFDQGLLAITMTYR